jgi:hypothetical protein
MSFAIDQSLSLMIPRVFLQWTDEQAIIDIFHQQHLGRIYKVSIIRTPGTKKRGYPIYQAFIYFSAWYENEIAYNFQQRIFGHRAQARVVYDDPWFWVAFENTKRQLSNNDKRLMRVGFQAYLNEEKSEQLEQRISSLENQQEAQKQQESELQAQLEDLNQSVNDLELRVEQFVSQMLTNIQEPVFTEEEDALVETATSVAEAVLVEPIIPSPVFVMPTGNEPRVRNWNNITEEFATMTLGEELALTETAINVAEAALSEEEESDDIVPSWMSLPYDCDDYDDDMEEDDTLDAHAPPQWNSYIDDVNRDGISYNKRDYFAGEDW